MSRELALFADQLPAPQWRWRDREGGLHAPSEMETRHLFFTFRMIWNNFMPAHMRVGTVRLYSFNRFYTRDYIREATIRIGNELLGRSDLTPQWRRELDEMRRWFVTEQDQLPTATRLIERTD